MWEKARDMAGWLWDKQERKHHHTPNQKNHGNPAEICGRFGFLADMPLPSRCFPLLVAPALASSVGSASFVVGLNPASRTRPSALTGALTNESGICLDLQLQEA